LLISVRGTHPSSVNVVVFGGKGGGTLVAFSLSRLHHVGARCAGFLNDVEPEGAVVGGIPVLGRFSSWQKLPESVAFVAPLHKAKQMMARAQLVRDLGIPRERWATVVDPAVVIADDVCVGIGSFLAPCATIMPGSRIGDHASVRHGAHLGHDSTLGDFVMLGVNAVVCGYVTIGEGAHIAPNAVIMDGVIVGRHSIVGLGAVVVRDVPERSIVIGNPARLAGTVEDKGIKIRT